jgi:hypothetical protein
LSQKQEADMKRATLVTLVLISLVALLGLAGCLVRMAPTPQLDATAQLATAVVVVQQATAAVGSASATAQPPERETPVPTVTRTPSATLTPGPTPTPARTAASTAQAPSPTTNVAPKRAELKGRIAYYWDRGIHIMNADGTNVSDKLTEIWAADPSLSPDGKRIAFTSGANNTGYNIFTVNADGTGLAQLTKGSHQWQFPAWSPDGTRIAFQVEDVAFSGQAPIGIMNADGSSLVWVTPQRSGEKCDVSDKVAWSPDSRRIAFGGTCDEDGVFVANLDGSDTTLLVKLKWTTASNRYAPDWSPDGKRIVFVAPDSSDESVESRIYVIDADGSNLTPLPFEGSWQLPTWSPDGKHIMLERWGEFLYVVNSDGSGEPGMVDIGRYPDWSR